ncbi:MAG: Holliday junction resolvase RuvX [Candidatus Izemoplasmatales bacterium]|nr:Holliday junction resolvase RuvX [Candidatus Izemoplasmatales bacterium]
MRVLGLDLGSKTLGMALSDPSAILATGIGTLRFPEHDYDQALHELMQVIEREKVGKIILGHPKNMDNTSGFQAQVSEEFKQKIEGQCDIEVVLWDERLTTRMAHHALFQTHSKRNTKKQKVDQIAATVLLQSYLDSRKQG